MPVDYFLGNDPPEDLAGGVQDPTVKALARATGGMDAAGKEQVLRFALFLQNYERRGGTER